MTKEDVLKKLSKSLGYSLEETKRINDIFEENFILGKDSKDRIVKLLVKHINVNEKEAERIYEKFLEVLKKGLIEKLKHPFGE